jgi:tetratricopeptide (TPR) repeat protein
MPSDLIFVSDLVVQRDGQPKVELPICVSNEDKLLGTIDIPAPPGRSFKKGDSVTLTCQLSENKLVKVTAKTGSTMVDGSLLNPLSNEALTPEESRMLLARQAVNLSALENGGRPTVAAMLAYAYACAQADHYLQAAEAFAAVERLDASRDFASNVCYHYAMAGKRRLSDKWAETAYRRKPDPISAFNLALSKRSQGDLGGFQTLMEESIVMNPTFAPALEIYGHHLKEKGLAKGVALIETAFEEFSAAFDRQDLEVDDFPRLQRAAETLGRKDVIARIERRRLDLGVTQKMYDEANLAVSTRSPQASAEGC